MSGWECSWGHQRLFAFISGWGSSEPRTAGNQEGPATLDRLVAFGQLAAPPDADDAPHGSAYSGVPALAVTPKRAASADCGELVTPYVLTVWIVKQRLQAWL